MAEALDLVHGCPLEPHRRHVPVTARETELSDEARRLLTDLLGANPAREDLWRQALTHGSTGDPAHYQRLEFLGDRVLGLAIAEWLYQTNEESEGVLSQRLNALVSRAMCAEIARGIGLGALIRLGKQARDDGGQESDNILGDVMEALIGAAHLELGFEGARDLVRRLWGPAMAGRTGQSKHPKSALQEWAAGNRRAMPHYRLVERSGPDHALRFTVAVSIHGVGEAQATASSKQEAEKMAAETFMQEFG